MEYHSRLSQAEIFGMVGPNGSGKTTTIECIEGLRQPDEGQISVLGLDPVKDIYALRERTGVQLQAANLHRRMRVGEALELFASFYRQPRDWHPLMEGLGLADKERVYFSQLSGGQQQRLFVALAMINQPEVVFLDELTTGLDPRARHKIWDLVREMREQGTTIFLTTHYMDEAERTLRPGGDHRPGAHDRNGYSPTAGKAVGDGNQDHLPAQWSLEAGE